MVEPLFSLLGVSSMISRARNGVKASVLNPFPPFKSCSSVKSVVKLPRRIRVDSHPFAVNPLLSVSLVCFCAMKGPSRATASRSRWLKAGTTEKRFTLAAVFNHFANARFPAKPRHRTYAAPSTQIAPSSLGSWRFGACDFSGVCVFGIWDFCGVFRHSPYFYGWTVFVPPSPSELLS